ncbi:esterase-like activity of phytase family protein [Sphaerisporangium album]|uniref:esterase-like activity of phytase family protein n=1 Tax=Sphaerisporangium album TaxID=509200 RepID=UPI0015F0801F|nr:esterase-like activity of phytase family protein [Sphaerisporangium album]
MTTRDLPRAFKDHGSRRPADTGLPSQSEAKEGQNANRAILIEREDDEGPAATFKRVYLIDRRKVDAQGFLVKTEVADLLNLRNPALIGSRTPGYGQGDPFKFPLQSVEALLPLPGNRILIAQDNNFPDSTGRVPGKVDATEMIIIGFPRKDDKSGRD